MKNFRNVFIAVIFSLRLYSQITTLESSDAQVLVENILGKGYTVTNAKLTCPDRASGTFVSVTSNIGLGKGICLTTGSMENVKGPNNTSGAGKSNGAPGDANLDSLSTIKTQDACVLEFDMMTACDELKISYVFASEEYPQYVNTDFNDVFAFFVSGPGIKGSANIATIPNTSTPVSINTVNASVNSQYFVDNKNGKTIQYNGFTTPLKASIKIEPCKTYHLKIAIADRGDDDLDSGVFIEGGSINCPVPEIITPPLCANESLIQICAPSGYSYQWPSGQPGAIPPFDQACLSIQNPKAGDVYKVILTPLAGGCSIISKTALKGSDFIIKDTSVCVGAAKFELKAHPLNPGNYTFKWEPSTNLSCSDCPNPVFDPLTSQTYTITMTDKDLSNCNRVKTVNVTVGTDFKINATSVEICEGDTAILTVTGADTYIWQPGNITGSTIKVSPAVTSTYTITGSFLNSSCPGTPITTAVIKVFEMPVVTASDLSICAGDIVRLNGKITGGTKKGKWIGGLGTFIPDRYKSDALYIPTSLEIDSGKVLLTLMSEDPSGPCNRKSKTITVSIKQPPKIYAGADQIICSGGLVQLNGTVNMGLGTAIWSGGKGTFNPNNTDNKAIYIPFKDEENAEYITLFYTSHSLSSICKDVSDTVRIKIDKKSYLSAGSSMNICDGTSLKLDGSVISGKTGVLWLGGTGIFTPGANDLKALYKPSVLETAKGKVELLLVSTSGSACPPDTSRITHIINPVPLIQFGVDMPKACPPHCAVFFDSTTIAGNSSIEKLEWDFGDGRKANGVTPKQVCFDVPGTYDIKLTAVSNNKCSSTLKKEKFVETYKKPLASFSIDPNPVSALNPLVEFSDESSSDVISWKMEFGDGKLDYTNKKNKIHVYPKEFAATYIAKLKVRNSFGCIDSTIKNVDIKPYFTFYIPNAFTPGENGINDTFNAKGTGITEFGLKIFDRWGNMIFESNDLSKGWDGKVKEHETVLQDTFVWSVRIKDILGKSHHYHGIVTVVK